MNFKQCNSTNFKVGRISNIKYIVIHYTSNDGDTAKNNADYFANNKNLSASAHYFVDENTINVDLIYNSAKTAIRKTGQIEYSGILFNETDIDKLYTYIKNAEVI